jgi:hypothetical protein
MVKVVPLSMRTPPREIRLARVREDPVDDSIDVPAAVVCATCGDAACAGCERELSRSGIVALVAWERPGPAMSRMWATARATTLQGEAFFELLPDGPIVPALRFALLVETIAATGFVLSSVPFFLLVAPSWVRHVLVDGGLRDVVLRMMLGGVPALAMLLVIAHAAHGLALDRGARKVGGRPAPGRALRFGLYASGWDLVLGPIGGVVLAMQSGLGAAVSLFSLGVGLPGRCTRAFLRGCYRIEGARAEEARKTSTRVAVVATLVGAVAILAAMIALIVSAW